MPAHDPWSNVLDYLDVRMAPGDLICRGSTTHRSTSIKEPCASRFSHYDQRRCSRAADVDQW